jgi:hypothetical protein
MTGVIWLVQVVNYPLYKHLSRDHFKAYQADHISRITPVVGPIMIIELFTSLALISFLPIDLQQHKFLYPLLINFVLVVLIWLATVSYSVPIHQTLKEGWDNALYKKLLQTNWTRTIAWTLRSLVLSYICYELLITIFI